MKAAIMISLLALAGCASSPEYVAGQSNFDVCRLTMGGPHSLSAEAEAARRGLDCRTLYPAIIQRQAVENAAVQSYIQSTRPAPTVNCTSTNAFGIVNTTCR